MKNKIALFTALLIMPVLLNAQTLEEINGLTYTEDGKLVDGRYLSYFENGKIKKEFNFSNGVKQGEFKVYYESGELMEVGHYADNVKHGSWIRYDENGNKLGEAKYKNGLRDGKWTIWDKNGTLRCVMFFDMWDKIGTWDRYNEEGILVQQESYNGDL